MQMSGIADHPEALRSGKPRGDAMSGSLHWAKCPVSTHCDIKSDLLIANCQGPEASVDRPDAQMDQGGKPGFQPEKWCICGALRYRVRSVRNSAHPQA